MTQGFLEDVSGGSLFALDDNEGEIVPEGRLTRPFLLIEEEFGTQPVGKFDMINHLVESGFSEQGATRTFNALLNSPEKFIRAVPEDEARFARRLRFTEESLRGKTGRDIKDTNIIQELESGLTVEDDN